MHLLAELRKMDDWDDEPSEPKIIVSIELYCTIHEI